MSHRSPVYERDAEPPAEHAHPGALLHHPEVAHEGQLQPAGHAPPGHRRDRRLGQLKAGGALSGKEKDMCTWDLSILGKNEVFFKC